MTHHFTSSKIWRTTKFSERRLCQRVICFCCLKNLSLVFLGILNKIIICWKQFVFDVLALNSLRKILWLQRENLLDKQVRDQVCRILYGFLLWLQIAAGSPITNEHMNDQDFQSTGDISDDHDFLAPNEMGLNAIGLLFCLTKKRLTGISFSVLYHRRYSTYYLYILITYRHIIIVRKKDGWIYYSVNDEIWNRMLIQLRNALYSID